MYVCCTENVRAINKPSEIKKLLHAYSDSMRKLKCAEICLHKYDGDVGGDGDSVDDDDDESRDVKWAHPPFIIMINKNIVQ